MSKKSALIMSLFLLLFCCLRVGFSSFEVGSSSGYPVRNLNTGLDYGTIQEAINAQETLDGHAILVDAGTYYGSITLNKSLCLYGQDRSTTIIDGNGTNKVVIIMADKSCIGDFTIQGGVSINYEVNSAIYVNSSNNVIVRNVLRDNDDYAIWVDSFSNNNTIGANAITRCWRGCMLKNSTDNSIVDNNITRLGQECISLWNSSHNRVSSNLMEERVGSGIAFVDAYYNNVTGNTFDDALFGIKLQDSYNNSFYRNNFLNNRVSQVLLYSNPGINSFDNGLEGNYWIDYNGTDVDHDGLGDELYYIDENNADNHPLMGKINFFPIFGDYTIVSNSTIVEFLHQPPYPGPPRLDVNVTGPPGTTGFCRISISKDYMKGPYNVTANGHSIVVPELPCSNNETAYLYFTYDHPVSGNITIVPEFPSFLVLQIFAIATLLAVIVCRRKHHAEPRFKKQIAYPQA